MKVLSFALIFFSYIIIVKLLSSMIERVGRQKSVQAYRIKYISKTLTISLTVVYLMLTLLILGVEYTQVSVFLSSAFAVIGIALFAQWSILSNITASLIIFFAFPYRVGDRIKILDKDDDISGIVDEITLFHVIVRKGDDLISYPNSLILQKAVVKLTETSNDAP